jgi:hypothetical protein
MRKRNFGRDKSRFLCYNQINEINILDLTEGLGMKKVKKTMLRFVTFLCPVVLAACYGPPMKSMLEGSVVDGASKEGIKGIEVSCMVGKDKVATVLSGPAGKFMLNSPMPCEELMFRDIDGDANGRYQEKQAPASPKASYQLDKQAP